MIEYKRGVLNLEEDEKFEEMIYNSSVFDKRPGSMNSRIMRFKQGEEEGKIQQLILGQKLKSYIHPKPYANSNVK